MNNTKSVITLLILILILTCVVFVMITKREAESFKTTTKPILKMKNDPKFIADMKIAVAKRLNIDESRITHLLVNPSNNSINLGIHNTNLNNSDSFETVEKLQKRVRGMVEDGLLGFTTSDGKTYNFSNPNATVDIVDTSSKLDEKNLNNNSSNNNTFMNINYNPRPVNSESFNNYESNQYIEDYNPVFDNIGMIKASIYLKDKYHRRPSDRQMHEFIRLDYDKNMDLIAKTELESNL